MLYVGGHDGANHLIGGGFQLIVGAPNFTAPQGAAIWDTSDKELWVSNGDGTWTAVAGSGGGGSGGSTTLTGTAGENLAKNALVYCDIDDRRGQGIDQWYNADIVAVNPVHLSPVLGFVQAAVLKGQAVTVQVGGTVTGLSGLTTGQPVLASLSGGITQNSPVIPASGTQMCILPIGVALSPSSLLLYGTYEATFVSYASGLANNGTVTVYHWPDYQARARRPFAYTPHTGATNPHDSPVTLGNWTANASATDRVLVRYADQDGDNQIDATTFKNVLGASYNLVCEVSLRYGRTGYGGGTGTGSGTGSGTSTSAGNWAYVQSNYVHGNASNGLGVAFSSNITVNNLIIATVVESDTAGGDVVGLSDSQGNSYFQAGSYYTVNWSGSYYRTSIWLAKAKATGNNTLTATSAATNLEMAIHEFSPPFVGTYSSDSTSTNTGNSTTASTGTIAVSGSNELCLAVFWASSNSIGSWTPGTGFAGRINLPTSGGGNFAILTEDTNGGVSSSQTANATLGTPNEWFAMGVSIKVS